MTVRTIKEIHARLVAEVEAAASRPPAFTGHQSCADGAVYLPESAAVEQPSTPLIKDGMGRWEVRSLIRLKSMARAPRAAQDGVTQVN